MSARATEANPTQGKPAWKKKLMHELIRYGTNFLYLAIFLGAFAWYRRFILAAYDISYLNYGTAIIEAFVR